MSVRYRHIAIVAIGAIVLAEGAVALHPWRSPPPSLMTVSALKVRVPALIVADMNLLDLPANPTDQQQALESDAGGALREAVLRTWDRDAADGRLRDVEANRQLMVRNRLDVYDEVRASVVSWDNVSGPSDNPHVRVTVSTVVRRAATGDWDSPEQAQWDFGLRQQPDGTWKLTSERVTAYLSGQG